MNKRMVLLFSSMMAAAGLVIGCLKAVATPEPAPGPTLSPVAVSQDTAPEAGASFAQPGFYTELDERDGRLWVFREGSDDLAAYQEKGRPANHVLRPGVGPAGLTLKSTESSTIIEYVASQPGFFVKLDERDGRLWVFREGSDDLAAYQEKGRPANHVLRPGAGPLGLTLKSTEAAVLDEYQARF